MKIRRILLTGDDGYNSIGTRLLVYFLKNKYELSLAATRDQQSGVGGLVHALRGGIWGKAKVDGLPAIWVDGSPVDAIECARTFFKQPFDLTISGINLGVNLGANIISSGTFAAAYRALSLGVSPRALAVSWDVHYRQFERKHSGGESLKAYLKYPGEVASKAIQQIILNNFWGAKLLNLNLPGKETHELRFARLLADCYNYWPPAVMEKNTGKFYFPRGNQTNRTAKLEFDTAAVAKGYLSLTPIDPEMLEQRIFSRLKAKIIKL